MTITLSFPWLLLIASVALIVLGYAAAVIFPNHGSQLTPDTPGCAGVVVLLLGVACGLVTFGLWLAGAFAGGVS